MQEVRRYESYIQRIPVIIWMCYSHIMLAKEKYIAGEPTNKGRLNSACHSPEKLILNFILCFFAFCFIVQVND